MTAPLATENSVALMDRPSVEAEIVSNTRALDQVFCSRNDAAAGIVVVVADVVVVVGAAVVVVVVGAAVVVVVVGAAVVVVVVGAAVVVVVDVVVVVVVVVVGSAQPA